MEARPISVILTHRDPDQDEVEGLRLLRRYGEATFPGVATAEITTTGERSLGKTAEALEAEGVLCIGIGGGRFDEHPFGERARREGECAATLVAKAIGADKIPAAEANIQYALKKNYSAETAEFEIAPLGKLALRYMTHSGDEVKDKENEKKILEAAFLLLDAAEENERRRLAGEPLGTAERSVGEFIADWLKDSFGQTEAEAKKAGMVFYWILQYAKKHRMADDGTAETGFELAGLAKYALRQGKPEAEVKEAVYIFLDAIWHKYENFFVACKKDFNSPLTRVAQIRRGEEVLNVTSVVSEEPEIAKYCRSQYGNGAAVVIKRTRSGNTQVFFNQKFGLDPKPIAKELRLAELAAQGITAIPTEETLVSQGKIKDAELWFFDGYQLLNGSNTANEVPTRLSREEVEKAVMKGLRQIPGVI